MYDTDRGAFGYVPNFAKAFAARPGYCALAHGSVLLDRELASPAEVIAVATDATAVTPDDVDRLRALGLADEEIVDVVLAAAMRCFFSKTLEALGAEPDAQYGALAADVRDALTVGHPIAAA